MTFDLPSGMPYTTDLDLLTFSKMLTLDITLIGRCSGFYISHAYSFWQDLSFDVMTLTL
jgi:hypothetical protein